MASYSHALPSQWSVEDVALWLTSSAVNLGDLASKWRDQGVNGARLLTLDRRQLDTLGKLSYIDVNYFRRLRRGHDSLECVARAQCLFDFPILSHPAVGGVRS